MAATRHPHLALRESAPVLFPRPGRSGQQEAESAKARGDETSAGDKTPVSLTQKDGRLQTVLLRENNRGVSFLMVHSSCPPPVFQEWLPLSRAVYLLTRSGWPSCRCCSGSVPHAYLSVFPVLVSEG